MTALGALEILVVDCQATAGARGRLLELGWARVGPEPIEPRSRLILAPDPEPIPAAVSRITGISEQLLSSAGIPAEQAWRELSAEASCLPEQPAPTVAHFARFERPLLERMAGGPPPLDLVCTHEMALRLLPDLPRRSLRALAGYFGRSVGMLRRSTDHVHATAFVWKQLLALLDVRGVRTWPELRAWLDGSPGPGRPARRTWPMPREVRLALPDRPGVYRMLRTSGDVLYVGKATSLRHRVNSYFRKQRGVHERTLEMLSQARALSFEVTESPLEAALLEPDEIKRYRPPYNRALLEEGRTVLFASRDLSTWGPLPSASRELGPLPSAGLLDGVRALAGGRRAALGGERWAPPAAVFDAGLVTLRANHRELATGLDAWRILDLGTRLWSEGRRPGRDDPDDAEEAEGTEPTREWTPTLVVRGLEQLAMRGALAVRRARWLTRIVESSLVWAEPSAAPSAGRLIVMSGGEIIGRAAVEPGSEPPVPPGHARTRDERHAGFTVARFDRLRILITELKRLVSEAGPVALRLGPSTTISGARLTTVLAWL